MGVVVLDWRMRRDREGDSAGGGVFAEDMCAGADGGRTRRRMPARVKFTRAN
ncbi:MAG TPA: hypothetical protein VLW50_27265 [Streptosporangiaceae bacterium]|nr:hypothetical protein [Streptosporangiaceae bacterium]